MFQRFFVFLVMVIFLILLACSHTERAVEESKKDSQMFKTAQGLGDLRLNLKVKKVVFENGLKLLIMENHRLPIFSYYTLFDVGGRYEASGLIGATHFLEHMMFKGAKKYGPGEFDRIITGNGGSNNAYTSLDETVYYENMPSHTLEKVADLEADRMAHLLLEEKGFESERNVVLEERRVNYDNSPRGQLLIAMMEAIFENTPYAHSVIGTIDDIKGLTRDNIQRYFKKFYAPNNAIIVIVGDVDTEKTVKLIKKKFGNIPRSQGLEKLKDILDDPNLYKHQGKYKREVKVYASTPVPLFRLLYKGEKIGRLRSYSMDILSSILGDGKSSYLYQKYIKSRRPLLNRVGAFNYTLRHNGVFVISGELLKRTNLKRFKKKLLKDTKHFCDKAINERGLQKTKNQYLVSYYKALETNAGAARFLGIMEMYFNDYSYYKKELEIYDSITVNDVKTVCKEIFDKGEYIFVSAWNRHPRKK